jgi:hypothetical protein
MHYIRTNVSIRISQLIARNFNNYFTSVAENIKTTNKNTTIYEDLLNPAAPEFSFKF